MRRDFEINIVVNMYNKTFSDYSISTLGNKQKVIGSVVKRNQIFYEHTELTIMAILTWEALLYENIWKNQQ